MRDFDLRAWLDELARLWRSSLQLRTIALTVLLSGVAIAIIGGYMSFSVGTNLFDLRRSTLETSSSTATLTAQRSFDQAAEQVGGEDIDATTRETLDAILSTASDNGETRLALLRTPGQAGSPSPQPDCPKD